MVLTFALAKAQGSHMILRMVHCGPWSPASATANRCPGLPWNQSPFPSRPVLTHGIPVTFFSEESIWRVEGEIWGSESGGPLAMHPG